MSRNATDDADRETWVGDNHMLQKRGRLPVSLTLVMVLALMAGCDYVGPENIHGLSDTDYELLANADPVINYQTDYTINANLVVAETRLTFHMTGVGALVLLEDTLLPGMDFDMAGTIEADDGRTGNFAIKLRFLNDGAMYMKVDEL
jgi:hypothetical protein